ncbi:MAG: hypothetical protein BAJATHORv1_150007 [Candidatus Thorarchaeota archaeon]|nr:MAG: hypothetical protein BAJATHORv1_150007 [Candidatus Thorarchaeota archaeon]
MTVHRGVARPGPVRPGSARHPGSGESASGRCPSHPAKASPHLHRSGATRCRAAWSCRSRPGRRRGSACASAPHPAVRQGATAPPDRGAVGEHRAWFAGARSPSYGHLITHLTRGQAQVYWACVAPSIAGC